MTDSPRPVSSPVRLLHTAVLVLIALGGAGLAVAADRPHNPAERPELTWRADAALRPWVERMAGEMAVLDDTLTELSRHGRAVLGRLQALDTAALEQALAEGEALVPAVDASAARLGQLVAEASRLIEPWRLGPTTAAQLEAIEQAAARSASVDDEWREMADHARRTADVLDALRRHNDLLLEAIAAGRQANWELALDGLQAARGALAEATELRDELSATADVETLDDLLGRYRAYDDALVELYEYVRDTGRQSGSEFEELEQRVTQAQAALPADERVLSVIVGETAAPGLAEGLVTIEQAHGRVNAALELVLGE